MRYKLGLRVHQVKVYTDEECVKKELSEISVGLITTHENKKTGLMCPAAECEYVSEMDRLDQNFNQQQEEECYHRPQLVQVGGGRELDPTKNLSTQSSIMSFKKSGPVAVNQTLKQQNLLLSGSSLWCKVVVLEAIRPVVDQSTEVERN